MKEYQEIRSFILKEKEKLPFQGRNPQYPQSFQGKRAIQSQFNQDQSNNSSLIIDDQSLQLLIRSKDRIQLLEEDNKYLRLYNKILEQEIRQLKQKQDNKTSTIQSSIIECQILKTNLNRALQNYQNQIKINQQLMNEISTLKNQQLRRKNLTREHRRWNQISFSSKRQIEPSKQERPYSLQTTQQNWRDQKGISESQIKARSISVTPKKYNYVAKITKNIGFKKQECDKNQLNISRFSTENKISGSKFQNADKQNDKNQRSLSNLSQFNNIEERLIKGNALRFNYSELKKNLNNATLFNKKPNQKITL